MPADARTVLLVGAFSVTDLVELGCRGQHAASEPYGVPLHVVGHDLNLNGLRFDATTAEGFADAETTIDDSFDVPLKPSAKVPEHGRPPGQNYVPIEGSSDVDRTVLNYVVDYLRERSREVRI